MSEQIVIHSKAKGTYTVQFITDLKKQISECLSNSNQVFVIDAQVAELFPKELGVLIDTQRYIKVQSSERHKAFEFIPEVISSLLALNIRKNDTIIAIGGGVVQDIVAFLSSILFRGLDWQFYPTTLLAQCDSCIGSKSSINFKNYKNLIGTFNPPSKIFVYHGFLYTLPQVEIKSGLGEMLHYFFSEGWNLARAIGEQYDKLLVDRGLLTYFIENSLRIKKAIIEIDEFDTSIRHIFNYGHTFGHAIEAITDYGICHGQAVSIGMDIANYLSLSFNMISKDEFDQMHQILVKNIPAFKLTNENIDAYLNALSKDKKNEGNQLGCILTKGPGKLEKTFLNIDQHLTTLLLNYSEVIMG